MHLPEFTWHVTAIYRDDVVPHAQECPLDRASAFSFAADLLTKTYLDVSEVIVERVERDQHGRCLLIRDVTDEMVADRFRVPLPVPCDPVPYLDRSTGRIEYAGAAE